MKLSDLDTLKLKAGDIVLVRQCKDMGTNQFMRLLKNIDQAKQHMPLLNDVVFIGVPYGVDMAVLQRDEYPKDEAEKYDRYCAMHHTINIARTANRPLSDTYMEEYASLTTEVGHYANGGKYESSKTSDDNPPA